MPQAKDLISIISLNPHSHPKRKVVPWLRPDFRWASSLPKATQLSKQVRMPTLVYLDLVLFPVSLCSPEGIQRLKAGLSQNLTPASLQVQEPHLAIKGIS